MSCKAKFPVWLFLLALLAGCAGPRYQTVYRYEAPTDAAGRACLVPCASQLAACQGQCQERHQACVAGIEPQVEARFQEKLQQFQLDIQYYNLALSLYQRRLALGFNHYYPFYGPRRHRYGYGYGPYFPPTPPFKPDRAQIFQRVAQEQCDQNCGCQPIYDSCFLACSGKKIPEVKCIAHCPEEK